MQECFTAQGGRRQTKISLAVYQLLTTRDGNQILKAKDKDKDATAGGKKSKAKAPLAGAGKA